MLTSRAVHVLRDGSGVVVGNVGLRHPEVDPVGKNRY